MKDIQEFTEKFAKYVEHYRKKNGLSLNELAEKSGISVSYLYRIIKGIRRPPSLYKVWSISNVLEMPLDPLFKSLEIDDKGSSK